jgi:hypothetical protein
MSDLKRIIERFHKRTISHKVLLNKFYFPNDDLRQKSKYQDIAFWYCLGDGIRPKSLLDVGTEFGLEASCVITGAKTSPLVSLCDAKNRFVHSNIRLAGGRLSEQSNWELGIVNGEFCDLLPSIWNGLKLDGLLCVIDYREAFQEFALVKNRTPILCEFRQKIGLLRK